MILWLSHSKPRKYSDPVSKSVTVRVPGKVNIYLGVGPREFSGFHELATIFQSVGIYDEVTVSAADSLTVVGLGAFADQIPTDSSNLAWKAAQLVARACGLDPNILIQIDKSIPIAAGMAGGSADAAATLVACDAFWNAGIGREQLDEMAATLGSDVPFMLHGGCALGVGRGDILSPVMTRGTWHWVFATFDEGLSTAQIYAKTDEMRGLDFSELPEVPAELLGALTRGDAQALGRALHNDLAAAAIKMRPVLGRVLEYGIDSGALGAVISGSGPTCAFLVHDESSAIDLVVQLRASGLVDEVLRTHGPVHGARVISTSR